MPGTDQWIPFTLKSSWMKFCFNLLGFQKQKTKTKCILNQQVDVALQLEKYSKQQQMDKTVLLFHILFSLTLTLTDGSICPLPGWRNVCQKWVHCFVLPYYSISITILCIFYSLGSSSDYFPFYYFLYNMILYKATNC